MMANKNNKNFKKLVLFLSFIFFFAGFKTFLLGEEAKLIYLDYNSFPQINLYFEGKPQDLRIKEIGHHNKMGKLEKVSQINLTFLVYPYSNDREFINYVHNLLNLILTTVPPTYKFLLGKIGEKLELLLFFKTLKEYVFYEVKDNFKTDTILMKPDRKFYTQKRNVILNKLVLETKILKEPVALEEKLGRLLQLVSLRSRTLPLVFLIFDGDYLKKKDFLSLKLDTLLQKNYSYLYLVPIFSDKIEKYNFFKNIERKKIYPFSQIKVASVVINELRNYLGNIWKVSLKIKGKRIKGERIPLDLVYRGKKGKKIKKKVVFFAPYTLGEKSVRIIVAPKIVNNKYAQIIVTVYQKPFKKIYSGKISDNSLVLKVDPGKYLAVFKVNSLTFKYQKRTFEKGDVINFAPQFIFSDLYLLTKDKEGGNLAGVKYWIKSEGKTIFSGETDQSGKVFLKLLNGKKYEIVANFGIETQKKTLDLSEQIKPQKLIEEFNFYYRNFFFSTKTLDKQKVNSYFIISKDKKIILTGETMGETLLSLPEGQYTVHFFWQGQKAHRNFQVKKSEIGGVNLIFEALKIKLGFIGLKSFLKKGKTALLKLYDDKGNIIITRKLDSPEIKFGLKPGNYNLRLEIWAFSKKKNKKEKEFYFSLKVDLLGKRDFYFNLNNSIVKVIFKGKPGKIVKSASYKIYKILPSGKEKLEKEGVCDNGWEFFLAGGKYRFIFIDDGIKWERLVALSDKEKQELKIHFYSLLKLSIKKIEKDYNFYYVPHFFFKIREIFPEWKYSQQNPLYLYLPPGDYHLSFKLEKNSPLIYKKNLILKTGRLKEVKLELKRLLILLFPKKYLKKVQLTITDFDDNPLVLNYKVFRSKNIFPLPLGKYKIKVSWIRSGKEFYEHYILDNRSGIYPLKVK